MKLKILYDVTSGPHMDYYGICNVVINTHEADFKYEVREDIYDYGCSITYPKKGAWIRSAVLYTTGESYKNMTIKDRRNTYIQELPDLVHLIRDYIRDYNLKSLLGQ